jgi:hypothetical protein
MRSGRRDAGKAAAYDDDAFPLRWRLFCRQ